MGEEGMGGVEEVMCSAVECSAVECSGSGVGRS